MIGTLKLYLVLSSFALLTGCASNARVQSSYDDSLDFSGYGTYNFSSRTEIKNPDLQGELELNFSAAVEQQMRIRGLVRAENPDILINVSVDVEDVSAPPVRGTLCPRYDDYYSRRFADPYAGQGRRPMCIYTEGSVNISMLDVEANERIWKGTSRVRLDEKDRGISLVRSVMRDVDTMFNNSANRGNQSVSGLVSNH
jgi:hypothetical protein